MVSVGSQKHCTSILPLARDQVTSPKGFNITSHPGEGFLFDIPEASGDFTVAIRLYSKNSMVQHGFSSDTTSSMGLSQSIESFSHGFSSLSSTNLSSSKYSLFNTKLRPGSSSSTTLNNQALEYDGLRTPAPPNSLGTCLGEMSFSLPTNHPFGKVSGTYTIVHAGKKETGKIVLQMGLFLDEEFHLPPVSFIEQNYLFLYFSNGVLFVNRRFHPVQRIIKISLISCYECLKARHIGKSTTLLSVLRLFKYTIQSISRYPIIFICLRNVMNNNVGNRHDHRLQSFQPISSYMFQCQILNIWQRQRPLSFT